MKVFYWTELRPEGSRFYMVDDDANYAAQIPLYSVDRQQVTAMIEAGFTEISWRTAYQLGLPT